VAADDADHACQGRGPNYLAQRCDRYGKVDRVRYAPDVRLYLCDECWCSTPPAFPGKDKTRGYYT
jgi:hypothetical protein